jgi:hypothetical protein
MRWKKNVSIWHRFDVCVGWSFWWFPRMTTKVFLHMRVVWYFFIIFKTWWRWCSIIIYLLLLKMCVGITHKFMRNFLVCIVKICVVWSSSTYFFFLLFCSLFTMTSSLHLPRIYIHIAAFFVDLWTLSITWEFIANNNHNGRRQVKSFFCWNNNELETS